MQNYYVIKRQFDSENKKIIYCSVDCVIERITRIKIGDVRPMVYYNHFLHPVHGDNEFIFMKLF